MTGSSPLKRARQCAAEQARIDREMRSELVAARRAVGLTQREVAERMGCTQQAVNKLERYDADPQLSTLRRYASAIGVVIEHQVVFPGGRAPG